MKYIPVYLFSLFIFTLSGTLQLSAQEATSGFLSKLQTEDLRLEHQGNMVTFHFNLVLDELTLKPQEMLTLLPVVVSSDSVNEQSFSPIVLIGSKRQKALKRSIAFDDFEFENIPDTVIGHKRGRNQVYPVSLTMPIPSWFPESSLVLYEDATGCACRDKYSSLQSLFTFNTPRLNIAYQEPYVEGEKLRSEAHTSFVNFQLDRYEILPRYKNNEEVLGEVDRIIREVQNDHNLKVTGFSITGYASPEGGAAHNMNLSKNRAHSFGDYLKTTYSLSENAKVDWKGADWDGLYRAMESSSFSYRDEVMSLIQHEKDVVALSTKIKRLDGGKAYQLLLRDYYPALRRTEYVISYISKPFSLSEAQEVIRKKPHLLSLHEMFRVAESYPRGSSSFDEVLEIMERFYGEDASVRQNRAAYLMEKEEWSKAIPLLKGIDNAESLNNLGVCYYHLQEYDRCVDALERSSASGYKPAKENLLQVQKGLGMIFEDDNECI